MAPNFYWYDLETSGTEPKWDRIVQFAGLRTDADLNPVGDELCTYVRLPDDVLPNPDATLVTGITPQLTHREGICETEALLQINQLFSQPNTCVAGYNSLRFDDEFVRYGLYRNLCDPYAREWQQGNSRWDLIDLVRATGALRRDGIEWPVDDEGLPVYKLEVLTKHNHIEHGHAHDAMSDVHATVAMARLIKQHQPKLFQYYFDLRHKKRVRALLEPYGAQICVHVSGMYPRPRFGTAPIVSVTRHPTNSNSIVVADLAEDIEPLLSWSAEKIAEHLFTAGADPRPPLKEIRINRCPFVATADVLNEENISRIGLNMKQVKERARRLRQPGIAEKIARVYVQERPAKQPDPDAALYDGFLQDEDRSRCRSFHEQLADGSWSDMDFSDKRLHTLAQRLKARSYAQWMQPEEQTRWHEFVNGKLYGSGDWRSLEGYDTRIDELLAEPETTMEQREVLSALQQHGQTLRARYPA